MIFIFMNKFICSFKKSLIKEKIRMGGAPSGVWGSTWFQNISEDRWDVFQKLPYNNLLFSVLKERVWPSILQKFDIFFSYPVFQFQYLKYLFLPWSRSLSNVVLFSECKTFRIENHWNIPSSFSWTCFQDA